MRWFWPIVQEYMLPSNYQLSMNGENNIMNNDIITTILTQYHISNGVKVFGQDGLDSVLAKLKQLHNRMVMDPTNPSNMSAEGKNTPMHYAPKTQTLWTYKR